MIGEVVTRLRAAESGPDRYGDPTYGDPTETDLAGALFAPGGTQEPVEAGRTAVITNPTLYFPGVWPDIVPTDQVRVRGDVYEVIGDPANWQLDGQGGLAVELRKVDG